MTPSNKQPELDRVTTNDFTAILRVIALNGLGLFYVDILFPYVSSIVLGLSATMLGLIFALITIGSILSSPIVGIIADNYSKKRLVLIGGVGRGISYFVMYGGILTRSLPAYFLGVFLLGFLTGFFWIPLNALISQKSHKYHRSLAFGRRDFALGIGQLVGGLSGFAIFSLGLWLDPNNLVLVFICMPIFGAINVYAGFAFVKKVDDDTCYIYPPNENIEPDRTQVPVNDGSIKSVQRLFLVGIGLFLVTFFISIVNGSLAKPFYQLYILTKLTSDPRLAMFIYVPTGFITVLMAPWLGRQADRFHPMYGICLLSLLGALITWALISTQSLWGFMLLLIFDVAINNTANLLLENMFSRISHKHRGKTFSARSAAAGLGGIAGPIIGGLLYDLYGPTFPFIASIFVELSLIVFFIIALKLVLPGLEEK